MAPLYGTWIRIERIQNATVPTGPATFRVAYRLTILESWTYTNGACSESLLPTGSLPPATSRFAVLARNSNSNVPAATIADNLRVGTRGCKNAGTVRITSGTSTSAVVSGLTPGASYFFQAVAGLPAITGPPLLPAAPVVLPPLTGNVAAGRPATMASSSSLTLNLASAGVNGVYDQSNNFFQTGPAPCGDYGCWWQLNLGSPMDVRLVTLWNNIGNTVDAAQLEVILSAAPGIAFSTVGDPCSPVPASLSSGSLTGNVTCSANGQYLTLLAPASVQLSMTQVEVRVANACPSAVTAFATQAPGSNCAAGAPFGAVCVQTCNPGYATIAGSTTSACMGAGWSTPQLVCAPLCPELVPPPNAVTCWRSLVQDSFTAIPSAPNSTLGRWFAPDPMKVRARKR